MKLLLPLAFSILGASAGITVGFYSMQTDKDPTIQAGQGIGASGMEGTPQKTQEPAKIVNPEYVKLNNQFVVPVVSRGHVVALIVMSLSLEIGEGQTESVYAKEPKLRDGFLRALFDHSNVGGFEGNFTDPDKIDLLRRALLSEAKMVLGNAVSDVLITDLARQDS